MLIFMPTYENMNQIFTCEVSKNYTSGHKCCFLYAEFFAKKFESFEY